LLCDVVKSGRARPIIPRTARIAPNQTMDFNVSSARDSHFFELFFRFRARRFISAERSAGVSRSQ
jgi:hypothetical protein